MTYTIRDANGNMLFAVEGVNPVNSTNNTTNDVEFFRSIESISADINNLNTKLNKASSMFGLISNTKAMESLGFYSYESEASAEKKQGIFARIGAWIKKIIERLKSFFARIGKWIKDKIRNLKLKIRAMRAKAGAKRILKAAGGNATDAEKDVVKNTARLYHAMGIQKAPTVVSGSTAFKNEKDSGKASAAIGSGSDWQDAPTASQETWAEDFTLVAQNYETVMGLMKQIDGAMGQITNYMNKIAAPNDDGSSFVASIEGVINPILEKVENLKKSTKGMTENVRKKALEEFLKRTAAGSGYAQFEKTSEETMAAIDRGQKKTSELQNRLETSLNTLKGKTDSESTAKMSTLNNCISLIGRFVSGLISVYGIIQRYVALGDQMLQIMANTADRDVESGRALKEADKFVEEAHKIKDRHEQDRLYRLDTMM